MEEGPSRCRSTSTTSGEAGSAPRHRSRSRSSSRSTSREREIIPQQARGRPRGRGRARGIVRGRGGRGRGRDFAVRLMERHFPAPIPASDQKQYPTRICLVCSKKGHKRKESRNHCPDRPTKPALLPTLQGLSYEVCLLDMNKVGEYSKLFLMLFCMIIALACFICCTNMLALLYIFH